MKNDISTINVAGKSTDLDEFTNFVVNVDVTGITETTTKEIALSLPSGISSVSPQTVQVVITVSNTSNGSSSGGSGNSPPPESGNGSSSSSSSSESSSESSSSSSAESESSDKDSSQVSSKETD